MRVVAAARDFRALLVTFVVQALAVGVMLAGVDYVARVVLDRPGAATLLAEDRKDDGVCFEDGTVDFNPCNPTPLPTFPLRGKESLKNDRLASHARTSRK